MQLRAHVGRYFETDPKINCGMAAQDPVCAWTGDRLANAQNERHARGAQHGQQREVKK